MKLSSILFTLAFILFFGSSIFMIITIELNTEEVEVVCKDSVGAKIIGSKRIQEINPYDDFIIGFILISFIFLVLGIVAVGEGY